MVPPRPRPPSPGRLRLSHAGGIGMAGRGVGEELADALARLAARGYADGIQQDELPPPADVIHPADRSRAVASRPVAAVIAPSRRRARLPAPAMTDDRLIGRGAERAELERHLAAARRGRGGIVLLAGEAGVGKTRLAEVVLGDAGLRVLEAVATPEATPPYGPIVAALRAYRRAVPDGLADAGPLAPYLALLLPELGPAPAAGDRATLFEAVRGALAAVARRGPAALFLDDLHWADDATLELLPPLARALEAEPLLVVGAYRSDDVPRGHALRRTRGELRRRR